MNASVCGDDSVSVEVGVASGNCAGVIGRNIPVFLFVVVRSVKPEVVSVLVLFVNGLVNKIPDEAACKVVVFFKGVHVFLKIAEAVFHCVRVFAKNNGLCVKLLCNGLVVGGKGVCNVVKGADCDRLALSELFKVLFVRIHAADNVALGEVKVALIVELPCSVKAHGGLLHAQEVAAVAGLVAETPHENAGVVPVSEHHSFHAVNNGLCPHRVVAGNALAAHAVGFKVTFVHYPEAVFIAKIIKLRIVRIVACSYGVDVCPFHYIKILNVSFARYCPAVVGVVIVAVDAPDKQRLTVDENFFADNFNLLEADSDGLESYFPTAGDFEKQGIKLRLFA